MTTLKLCGIAIVAVMLIMTLRQLRPEFATAVTIVTSIIIFTITLACFSPTVEYLASIAEAGGESEKYGKYIEIVLKSLGIGLLTQSAGDICRDSGETAIASKIELAGKAEIFLLTLPLVSELLSLTSGLLM